MTSVLNIIQSLSLGGAARAMIATGKYSSRNGRYKHAVLSLGKIEPDARKLAVDSGLEVFQWVDRATTDALIGAHDIVQIHFWNCPEMYMFLQMELPPARYSIWYHIAGDQPPQVITPEIAALTGLNIACSPHTFQAIEALDLRDKSTHPVHMVYGAADFARLSSVSPKTHAGFNIGYIGTVDFVKMHPSFVRMSAAANIPDVKYIVCGTGQLEVLQQQVEALDVTSKFDFKGHVEDVAAILSSLDVYGYPLCEDTYAASELNLQEAMYAGIPPVVFPHGGIRELIEPNVTGLVVTSEREYTEALEFLFRHPEERQRIGSNAAAYARQYFGAENAARDLNALYDQYVTRPRMSYLPWRSSRSDNCGATTHGAKLFTDSLGSHGAAFSVSLEAREDAAILQAEQDIARSSCIVHRSGVIPYRRAFPRDPHLALWSGLLKEANGEGTPALSEYLAAKENGLTHWRVYWYLARALAACGRQTESEAIYNQLRAIKPDISIPPAKEAIPSYTSPDIAQQLGQSQMQAPNSIVMTDQVVNAVAEAYGKLLTTIVSNSADAIRKSKPSLTRESAALLSKRLAIANSYVESPVREVVKWLFNSREDTNFTYDLTEMNKLHLASFVSNITGVCLDDVRRYIGELSNDYILAQHIERKTRESKEAYRSDITAHYGRRLGWYACVRAMKPRVVVETGIDKGLGAVVLASALLRNAEEGYPGRYYGTDIDRNAGFLLSGRYRGVGEILYGDSIQSLRAFSGQIDLFINDSDHSREYEAQEYLTIEHKLSPDAIVIGDNAHVTDELYKFSLRTGREFLYFQEQPKDHWYAGAGIGVSFSKKKVN